MRDVEVRGRRHCECALLFVMAAGSTHVEVDNARNRPGGARRDKVVLTEAAAGESAEVGNGLEVLSHPDVRLRAGVDGNCT